MKMQDHRLTGRIQEGVTFNDVVCGKCPIPRTLGQKIEVLCSIPNNHYWKEKKQSHILFSTHMSVSNSSYKPSSPRNLILYHWKKTEEGKAISVFDELCEKIQPSDQLPDFVDTDPLIHHRGPQKRARRAPLVRVSEFDLLRRLESVNPNFVTHNAASSSTAYLNYRTSLIEHGKLYWRVHNPTCDVVAMNDIDINSGSFLDHQFVHVTCSHLNNNSMVSYDCSCDLYSTLIQIALMESNPEQCDISEISCCHIRFFRESISPKMPGLFLSSFSPITVEDKFLLQSLQHRNIGVCCVSNTNNSIIFSVLSLTVLSCVFVRVHKRRVSCLSSECSSKHGSKRKIDYLWDSTDICEHLQLLKANKECWVSYMNYQDQDAEDSSEDEPDTQIHQEQEEHRGHESSTQNAADKVQTSHSFKICFICIMGNN